MTTQPIDLGDLSFIEIPYKIGGKIYTLKEASGDAACAYRNALFKNTELGPDGKARKIGNMADTEPLLVSWCLYDANGHRVAVQGVRNWPAKVVKTLFEKAKEISNLEEEPLEKTQLIDALAMSGSPCSYEDLKEFIGSLPEARFEAVQRWMDASPEDLAQNAQSCPADGSE